MPLRNAWRSSASASTVVMSVPRQVDGVVPMNRHKINVGVKDFSEVGKAAIGFEPMNNGFAIRPLEPLGYAAEFSSNAASSYGVA